MTTTTTAAAAATPATQVTSSDQGIDQMYNIAHKLDSSPSFEGDEALFVQILAVAKQSKLTKQLTSQLLSKYFKRFPAQQEKALETLIDIIEEDNTAIRVSALKAIPSICRDNPDYISKLVDILGQVLNTDAPIELESARNVLIELYRLNSATTLASILIFLESDNQKEFMLKFLKEKLLVTIKNDYAKSTPEAQTFFRERILKMIITASPTETDVLKELFDCFPQYTFKEAVEFVDKTLPLMENLKIVDYRPKLIFLVKILIKKTGQQPEYCNCKIFDFFSKRVFPSLVELESEEDRTELLLLFAQITQFVNSVDAPALFETIYNYIKEYIPVPLSADYDLKFKILEALLYSFSNLGQKSSTQLRKLCAYKTNTGQPSDMATELDPSKFEELVARLRALYEKVGITDAKLKKAREVLPKDDEQRISIDKNYASTQNLLNFVKNLSKNPPTLSTAGIQ
eukprot:gene18248-21833_t